MLIQYIKRGNKLKGVMIAFTEKGIDNVYIGWALCHPKDRFDKGMGINLAQLRAFKWSDSTRVNRNPYIEKIEYLTIPISIENQLYKFILRSEKYFKESEMPAWVKEFKRYVFFNISTWQEVGKD